MRCGYTTDFRGEQPSNLGSSLDGVQSSKVQRDEHRIVEPSTGSGDQDVARMTHAELCELLDKAATDAANHVSQALESSLDKRVDELLLQISGKVQAAEQQASHFQK